MKKMGWAKGEGLGKNKTGTSKNLKVKSKDNYLGIGADIDSDEKWVDLQHSFNDLLRTLNENHSKGFFLFNKV
jgi:Pin2-interacting protein X1